MSLDASKGHLVLLPQLAVPAGAFHDATLMAAHGSAADNVSSLLCGLVMSLN